MYVLCGILDLHEIKLYCRRETEAVKHGLAATSRAVLGGHVPKRTTGVYALYYLVNLGSKSSLVFWTVLLLPCEDFTLSQHYSVLYSVLVLECSRNLNECSYFFTVRMIIGALEMTWCLGQKKIGMYSSSKFRLSKILGLKSSNFELGHITITYHKLEHVVLDISGAVAQSEGWRMREYHRCFTSLKGVHRRFVRTVWQIDDHSEPI